MMLTLMVTAGPTAGASERGSTSSQYDLLARLAAGGMAEIFLARSNGLAGFERYVVLKRIRPERGDDARWVGMFLDEARLAAQLQHPNIAQVFDLGQIGDDYFYTMEYVHGEDVLDILARTSELKQPMPVQVALAIIAGACGGLAHAHERRSPDGRPLGIVHRDISPSNLMVSYEGTVKVVDFGVAKARFRQTETQAGTIMGKVAYLSPEQCTTGEIDHRSDIFSLGIVLYEMLTGQRLFKRETDYETLRAVAHDHPIAPSAVIPNLPRGLDEVVARALAKDPHERFESAHAMLDALEEVGEAAGMSITGNVLRRYMRDLFGQREEPWRELERQLIPELEDEDVELIEESRPRIHGLPMNIVADAVPMLDSETGMIDLDALFGRDRASAASVVQTKRPPPPVMPRASGPVTQPPLPSGPISIPTGSIVMVPLPVPNARVETNTSIERMATGSADGVPYPVPMHVSVQTAAVTAPKRSTLTVILTAVGVVAAFVIAYVLVVATGSKSAPASVSGSGAAPKLNAGPTVTHIDEPAKPAAPAAKVVEQPAEPVPQPPPPALAVQPAPKAQPAVARPAAQKPAQKPAAAKPEPAKKEPATCSDPLDCQF